MTKLHRFFIMLMVCIVLTINMTVVYAVDDAAASAEPDEEISEDYEDDEDDGSISVTDVLFGRETLGDLFNQIFINTIGNFITDILNGLIELLDSLALNTLMAALHIENYFDNIDGSSVLRPATLQSIYTFIYQIAVTLVTLKFLFKGFQIYILWRNGDADASPRDMLIGAITAEVFIICFPFGYELVVDIITYFVTNILSLLGGATTMPPSDNLLEFINRIANSLVSLLCLLIWVVMAFILYVKLVMQGLELMILRLGLPLATVGMVDSDMQLFKNYIQVFIKTFLTITVQVTMMSLSMRVIITSMGAGNLALFLGIGMMSVALSTPKLLSQFLVPQGSAGMLQKASSVAMIARSVKALFV